MRFFWSMSSVVLAVVLMANFVAATEPAPPPGTKNSTTNSTTNHVHVDGEDCPLLTEYYKLQNATNSTAVPATTTTGGELNKASGNNSSKMAVVEARDGKALEMNQPHHDDHNDVSPEPDPEPKAANRSMEGVGKNGTMKMDKGPQMSAKLQAAPSNSNGTSGGNSTSHARPNIILQGPSFMLLLNSATALTLLTTIFM